MKEERRVDRFKISEEKSAIKMSDEQMKICRQILSAAAFAAVSFSNKNNFTSHSTFGLYAGAIFIFKEFHTKAEILMSSHGSCNGC